MTDDDPADWIRRLSVMERALLDRLVCGGTIASAASAEYLSLRTANRRIADLRRRAGVRTTRELVAYYRNHRGDKYPR